MASTHTSALKTPPRDVLAASALGYTRPTNARIGGFAALGLAIGAAIGWITWTLGITEGSVVGPMLAGAVAALAGVGVAAVGLRVTAGATRKANEELLKVASPAHPLMRRLLVEAPGTYVHSAAVANLAESGAEAIGADPLLARVGAYYHDVGKLSEPCYYFENQDEGANPHDAAHPARSAELIMAHVPEGVNMGRSYGLPESVIEIIQDHHATSLVRYFYHRAAEADASTYESDFRYRGKVPSTREAAIVMLADASEASVRAMAFPEADRIETSVRAVMNDRLADHQLDDSGLTSEDLERLVKVFVRQLVSFRHVRCAYPLDQSKGDASCRSAS